MPPFYTKKWRCQCQNFLPKFLVKRRTPRCPTSVEQVIPAQWVEAFGEGDASAPPGAGRHANRKDRRRRSILCETRPQLRSGSRDAGCSVASRLRRMMKHTNPRPTTRSSTWTNTTREKWIARCMNNDHVISKPIPSGHQAAAGLHIPPLCMGYCGFGPPLPPALLSAGSRLSR